MIVRRYSTDTDSYAVMEVAVDKEQLQEWMLGHKTIDVMPDLTIEQRNFLLNLPPLRTML